MLVSVPGARAVIHCGDLYPTSAGGTNNEVLNLFMAPASKGAPDEVVLLYYASVTKIYLSEEAGGTFGFITSELPKSRWKVVPVVPQPGRQPKKLGIHDMELVNVRSAYGTFLMEAGEARGKEWTFNAELRSAPMPSPNNDLVTVSARTNLHMPSSPVVALHFGETMYLTFRHVAPTDFARRRSRIRTDIRPSRSRRSISRTGLGWNASSSGKSSIRPGSTRQGSAFRWEFRSS